MAAVMKDTIGPSDSVMNISKRSIVRITELVIIVTRLINIQH